MTDFEKALRRTLTEIWERPFPAPQPARHPRIGPQTELDDLVHLSFEQQRAAWAAARDAEERES